MDKKNDLRSFLFGLLIILAVISTMASITYLLLTRPVEDPCVKHGLWLFVSPGYEPKVVELFPGEGGYKIAKTTGILLIWKDGKVVGSARIDEHAFRGTVAVDDHKTQAFCGMLSFQPTEQIYVDQPWWLLTEDA